LLIDYTDKGFVKSLLYMLHPALRLCLGFDNPTYDK